MKHIINILSTITLILLLSANVSAKREQEVAPSYAWTLLEPLGLREPSTIDTTLYNYYLHSVPSAVSEAYATTGNLGAPGMNMIFFDRKPVSDFFFRDALLAWIPTLSNHKFYNTRIPMTLLSYNTGGSRNDAQDRLNGLFSGNVNEKIEVGAMLDYIYSKGSYENQAVKNLAWGLFGSYISDRYDAQVFFNHYNSINKENGGITDDLYITDPGELQGGNTSINPKSIPTMLSNAHSRIVGQEFFMNHRYKVGFYQDIPRNDSIPDDTVQHRRFIPAVSFIWTLDYIDARHQFINSDATNDDEFWQNCYLSGTGTREKTSYWSLRNTLGVSLLEGFNKYAKMGLSAFLTHEVVRYNQVHDTIPISGDERPDYLTPYPYDSKIAPRHTEQRLYVGAQLTKQQGSLVRYEATGRLGLVDRTAGDIYVRGDASLRIPLWRDTLSVTAYGHFTNTEAPYLLEKYVSNHFIWNNDFGKTRSVRLGGQLNFPRTHTHLDIGVENVQNQLYFNSEGLPRQHSGSVQVFSARLNQDFKVGILHWNNRLTYQTSSNDGVIPLPKFAVYSNLFILFRIAKVLHVQFGIDCDYYTKYYAPSYQPASMAFCNQRSSMVGNYAFMNAYVNCKMKRARFYVMMSHVNQGLMGNNYFSMPHYPLNPRRFQMGVSVDFAN